MTSICVLPGSAGEALASGISELLGVPVTECVVGRYPDGELRPRVEQVRGRDVFVVQSTSPPVGERLMELLLLLDACRMCRCGQADGGCAVFRLRAPRSPGAARSISGGQGGRRRDRPGRYRQARGRGPAHTRLGCGMPGTGGGGVGGAAIGRADRRRGPKPSWWRRTSRRRRWPNAMPRPCGNRLLWCASSVWTNTGSAPGRYSARSRGIVWSSSTT